MNIEFFVAGTAKPAGSKRAFVLKKGGVFTGRAIITDDCKTSRDWKHDVKCAAQDGYKDAPLTCPLELHLVFLMARPRGHYGSGKNEGQVKASAPKFPAVKPDTTKLIRGVEDALSGIIYKDDALIVYQTAIKRYGERPGVHVCIREAIP